MNQLIKNIIILPGLALVAWLGNGTMDISSNDFLLTSAEARFGRPATPVSYAGVARRSTVRRAATPGVGAPGVGVAPGVGAPGVGVRPGAGAGAAGVGYSRGVGANLGGPVNRVGIR